MRIKSICEYRGICLDFVQRVCKGLLRPLPLGPPLQMERGKVEMENFFLKLKSSL